MIEHARPPRVLDALARRRDRGARLALADHRPDRGERVLEPPLERDVDQAERIGRRADDRGGLELGDRSQAFAALQAAERQRERADVLDARRGRPELEVGAERERQRHAIRRGDARLAQDQRKAAPLGEPVLGRLQDAQTVPHGPARQVQVRVVLERERQVRAVRRRGRLVGQQLVLGGERERAQIVERANPRTEKARALERVGLRTRSSNSSSVASCAGRRLSRSADWGFRAAGATDARPAAGPWSRRRLTAAVHAGLAAGAPAPAQRRHDLGGVELHALDRAVVGHVADAHERDDLAEAELVHEGLEALADGVGAADHGHAVVEEQAPRRSSR